MMSTFEVCARPTVGNGPLLVPSVMSFVADVAAFEADPVAATATAQRVSAAVGILIAHSPSRSVRRVVVEPRVVRLGHVIGMEAARAVIALAHLGAGIRDRLRRG